MKKIVLTIYIFFWIFLYNSSLANLDLDPQSIINSHYQRLSPEARVIVDMPRNTPAEQQAYQETVESNPILQAQISWFEAQRSAQEQRMAEAEIRQNIEQQRQREQEQRTQRDTDCANDGSNCIDKPNFMIWTTTMFWWDKMKKETSQQTINNLIWNLIQRLVIWLWIIAGLIMTIWAWYMIVYHGQDELLTRWKNIFMMGITGLVVALISYQLIALVRYILYQG